MSMACSVNGCSGAMVALWCSGAAVTLLVQPLLNTKSRTLQKPIHQSSHTKDTLCRFAVSYFSPSIIITTYGRGSSYACRSMAPGRTFGVLCTKRDATIHGERLASQACFYGQRIARVRRSECLQNRMIMKIQIVLFVFFMKVHMPHRVSVRPGMIPVEDRVSPSVGSGSSLNMVVKVACIGAAS